MRPDEPQTPDVATPRDALPGGALPDPLDDPRGWFRSEWRDDGKGLRRVRAATPEERIAALEDKIARLQATVDGLVGQARADRPAIGYAAWRERQFRASPVIAIAGALLAILLAVLGGAHR